MKITGWVATLSLVACSSTTEPEEKKPETHGRTVIVGRVASIPPGDSFVLIQSFGEWKVKNGAILTTRGADERTANLRVTGENLGQFAAADIQSGEVKVGDAVLMLPAPAPGPRPGAGTTEAAIAPDADLPRAPGAGDASAE